MSEIAWVLLGLAGIVFLNVMVCVLIARAAYRGIRRNRALNGAALRTRAHLTVGQQREVLKLRVRLQQTLVSGRAAVDLVARSESPRGEVPRLYRRIESEGVALEAQLRLLESENEPDVLTEELGIARYRVEQVCQLVRRLRSAVSSGLGTMSDDTLVLLRADVDREVTALHAGVQELHSLHTFPMQDNATGQIQKGTTHE